MECNIDDILIHGRTKKHDHRLYAALNKLKEVHITLNPEKFELIKISMKILAHIFCPERI